MDEEPAQAAPGEPAPPDAYELAVQALRSGSPEEAIGILTREMAQERSGRARFHRKAQVAQICLTAGYESVAEPILRELAAEIERRKLEDWEAADVLANPLVLLYRCLAKAEASDEEKRKLYARICWLDPSQALSC
jgi:type VI secretion system protein ImpA